MKGPPVTIINEQKCNGCGLCVSVCPSNTLEIKDGKAHVRGKTSIYCTHCEAVCPRGAIEVPVPNEWKFDLKTIPVGSGRTPRPEDIFLLMRMRHSTRLFLEEPVPYEVLEDLVSAAITAPSGTNSQKWNFTLVPERNALLEIGNRILSFYKKLNRKARNPLYRFISRIVHGNALVNYYNEYYAIVESAIKEWEAGRRDRLFHGAPSAMIISSSRTASCPKEDALLAAGNVILMAEAMGYGTCLIGFAVEAINRDLECRESARIPSTEDAHAFIVLGKKAADFRKPRRRRRPILRTVKQGEVNP